MSISTPRQRGLQRPSYGANGISPSNFSASTTFNRKASMRALTGQQEPTTPGSKMGGDFEVGDAVDVPGGLWGTVRFIGSVKGKAGTFCGVELDAQFASKGKNNGEVSNVQYFTTTIPGAGIFLPINRAERRSPAMSIDSFPGTPNTPSYSTINGQRAKPDLSHTPSLPHKFAQTVGPGARPASPNFKPKRPSLPRPESPFRKPAPSLAPTPARHPLSQSTRGTPRPGMTPSKSSFTKSTTTRPSGQTPRPYSRAGSRIGHRQDGIPEEDRTPVGVATTSNARTISTSSVPSFSQPLRSPARLGSAGSPDAEIQRLRSQLSERDRRLEEQAASLSEMEQSVKELSSIMPIDGANPGTRQSPLSEEDEQSTAQLRQMLREKNEKISMLTAEFDVHRADFRSTLDSLEMASTETERVYEEQKRDLLAQLAEMQELRQSKEDFEGVAQQLKQLEELVAELEEGLEESRRGEAEARGEVEFLRGEVERGRSELKREREKSASAVKSAENGVSSSKEMSQKDDEIRGLKAIVHSLSSNPSAAAGASEQSAESEEQVKWLQTALEDSLTEKEELEKEIEQLRRETATTNGHTRNESERTATAPDSGMPVRPRGDTIKATFAEHVARNSSRNIDSPIKHFREADTNGTSSGGPNGVYCEMCESADHDTLDCTRLRSEQDDEEAAEPYSPGKENEDVSDAAGGKAKVQEEKWCALCEEDGHLAFDCPNEQY